MSKAIEKMDSDIPILIAEANFTHLSELKRNFEQFFLKNLNLTGRGFRAIELSRREKFDVIFISNPLVDLEGLQVIQAIREGGKNTTTPIVFVSEHQGQTTFRYPTPEPGNSSSQTLPALPGATPSTSLRSIRLYRLSLSPGRI